MFNGEQMRKMEKWEKEPHILSPAERAETILANSKAVIEHGGDDMFYDRETDTIVIPEREQFARPEQYYAEALHQLAHWTAAEDRLNRPQDHTADELSHVKEELRTNLASLYMSKELNLPYELNEHVGYLNAWSEILKTEPGELFKAASDAQKIVDVVLGFENQIEEKREVSEEQVQETGQSAGAADTDLPLVNPDKLNKGEIIPHNDTQFKVVSELKNKVYQMQDLGDGRKFKMSAKDELFKVLLDARNNSQEIAVGHAAEHAPVESMNEQQEEVNNYQMQR